MSRTRAVLALLIALASGRPAVAQQVRAAVVPDTGTVGSVRRVAIRIDLPSGVRLTLPDTLDVSDPLENVARVRRTDVDSAGATRVTAVYEVTAWRPGEHPLPPLSIAVAGNGAGERTLTVGLPVVRVSSVLPEDTTGIRMKADADVLGADRIWWPWILAALLLLAAIIAAIVWLRRRRRAAPVAPEATIPPRERALAALDALGQGAHLRHGDFKGYYSELSEALRRFAAATDRGWSVDLTTPELRARILADAAHDALDPLLPVLERGDMVKFARLRPSPEVARDDLARARAWVAGFRSAPPTAAEEAA